MVGSVAGGPTSGFPLQFIGFSQGTCQEKDPCLVQRSVCQLTTFTRNSVSASLLTELHAAQNILTLCCASSNQTFLSVFCSYLGIVWWMLTVLVVKEINLWKTPLRLGGDHIIEACDLPQGAGTEHWQKRRVHQGVISLHYALTPKVCLYDKTELVFN